jgi:hypothetical protein
MGGSITLPVDFGVIGLPPIAQKTRNGLGHGELLIRHDCIATMPAKNIRRSFGSALDDRIFVMQSYYSGSKNFVAGSVMVSANPLPRNFIKHDRTAICI